MGITRGQRAVLERLAPLLPGDAYLAGGVAVALHLHHRRSRDLDVFVTRGAPEALAPSIARIGPDAKIVSRADGTLYAEIGSIPVGVLRYDARLLARPRAVDGLPIAVASLDDLACMKLSAIVGRGAAKDFWDLHEIVVQRRRPLAKLLGAYARKYPRQDVGHVVRSLAYFVDAEAEPRPAGLTAAHWRRVRADIERWTTPLASRR